MWAAAGRNRFVNGEQGAVIMEFVLSVMLLLTLVFGVMEMAFVAYSFNLVSEAAREATRYAVVRGNDWGASCSSYSSSDCIASAANVTSYVENLGLPGINGNTLTNISTNWTKGPNESSCTATNCNGMGDQVTVTISYTFTPSIPFVLSKTVTMSSSSTMIVLY